MPSPHPRPSRPPAADAPSASAPASPSEVFFADTPLGPAALRALPGAELRRLADRIRGFLIEKVTARGGHLGPNLGVVELTIALHRVFDSPRDLIVFDTGHQSYVHKLLTGRAAGFDRLRQDGGLSGYPSRTESEHDWVENSHASTALSWADGMAKALQLRGRSNCRAVAVVGDGALTGGMAHEALNNIGGAPERPVIVVLNDNGRSYEPTTGALARHLAELRAAPGTQQHGPNYFTSLGLAYLGPVDGHDIAAVEGALRRARELSRPVVVHCVTVKGKGHPPAEGDARDCQHAVGPASGGSSSPSWTSVFGQELVTLGERRPELVAVTAAMLHPTGLAPFAERFPERTFDVGIAEQHAVTSAAGLAAGRFHPVAALYATFLNRAFDQVLMDVALHRLPMTLVLDRSGITGPDGPSHHGMWDLAMLSAVPGLRAAAPRDTLRLRELLEEAVSFHGGPTALRLPKAAVAGPVPALRREDGVDILLRHGPPEVLLVAYGPLAGPALTAAGRLVSRGTGVTVADPRWALPASPALAALAAGHRLVVTAEDGVRGGGAGAALAQAVREGGSDVPVHVLGLPRRFVPHGSRARLLGAAGLDADGLTRQVLHARTAASCSGRFHDRTGDSTGGSPHEAREETQDAR